MIVIQDWVKDNKVPIPFSEVSIQLLTVNKRTLRAALDSLCNKGYIRKSCAVGETAYVLRRKI